MCNDRGPPAYISEGSILPHVLSLSQKDYGEYVRLLVSHQASIRAFVISRMPGLPGASDVVQEVNLILWKKRTAFKIGTNFRAWAFAIARKKVSNHIRVLKRTERLPLSDQLLEELAEDGATEPDQMDSWIDALDQCLGRLNEEQRELINFRYRGGSLTNHPSGASPGALRTRLHRIRALLRNCIKSRQPAAP